MKTFLEFLGEMVWHSKEDDDEDFKKRAPPEREIHHGAHFIAKTPSGLDLYFYSDGTEWSEYSLVDPKTKDVKIQVNGNTGDDGRFWVDRAGRHGEKVEAGYHDLIAAIIKSGMETEIVSGGSQTKGSKKAWERLKSVPGIEVKSLNAKTGKEMNHTDVYASFHKENSPKDMQKGFWYRLLAKKKESK